MLFSGTIVIFRANFFRPPSKMPSRSPVGASNMSGKYRGVQARVKEMYPLAMYTHCCNHVHNLDISTSSQLPVIRNAMATISEIRVFLSRSAQRVSIFQDNVEREVSGSAASRQKLKPICATRWVERHNSIIIFVTYCQRLFLHLRNCSRKTSKWRLRPKQQLCSILYRNARF